MIAASLWRQDTAVCPYHNSPYRGAAKSLVTNSNRPRLLKLSPSVGPGTRHLACPVQGCMNLAHATRPIAPRTSGSASTTVNITKRFQACENPSSASVSILKATTEKEQVHHSSRFTFIKQLFFGIDRPLFLQVPDTSALHLQNVVPNTQKRPPLQRTALTATH